LRSKGSVPLGENTRRIPDRCSALFIARNSFQGVRLLVSSACDMAEVLCGIGRRRWEIKTTCVECYRVGTRHRCATPRPIKCLHVVGSRIRCLRGDIIVWQWPALTYGSALHDCRLLHRLCGDSTRHWMLVHDRAVHTQGVLKLERLARISAESFTKGIDLLLDLQLCRRSALLKYTHMSGEVSSRLRVQSRIRTRDCNLHFVSSLNHMSVDGNLQDEAWCMSARSTR
jgi:hypothetical protein